MGCSISPEWLADPATLLPSILIGFAAQLVGGALGIAFGVISNTLLITVGLPPIAASASVHRSRTSPAAFRRSAMCCTAMSAGACSGACCCQAFDVGQGVGAGNPRRITGAFFMVGIVLTATSAFGLYRAIG